MVNILSPSGIEDPIGGEAHSRALLSRNWNRINDQLTQIDYVNGSYTDANWNFTACRFTRVRVGVEGIIIVELILTLTAVAIPVNTAATLSVAGVIPAGYRPLGSTSIPVISALTSNAGVGQGVGIALKSDGSFGIRSQGAAFTATAGSNIYAQQMYRWDGVL